MLVQFTNAVHLHGASYHDDEIPTFFSDSGVKGVVHMDASETHTHLSVRLVGTMTIESVTGEGIWISTTPISTTRVLDLEDCIDSRRKEISFSLQPSNSAIVPASLNTGLSLVHENSGDILLKTLRCLRVKVEYRFLTVAFRKNTEIKRHIQYVTMLSNPTDMPIHRLATEHGQINLQPRFQTLLKSKSLQSSVDMVNLDVEVPSIDAMIRHANSDHAVTKFAMRLFLDVAPEHSSTPPKTEFTAIYTLKALTTVTVKRSSRNEKLYLERFLRLKSETFTVKWRQELNTRPGSEVKKRIWVGEHESWLVAPSEGASDPTFLSPSLSHEYRLQVKLQACWLRRCSSLKGETTITAPVIMKSMSPEVPTYSSIISPPPIDFERTFQVERLTA